jgi:hypothetical protein
MTDIHGCTCSRCNKEINVYQLLNLFVHYNEFYVMKELKGIGTFREALCPTCTVKLIRFMEGVKLKDE